MFRYSFAVAALSAFFCTSALLAHCDTMDGPVVKAGQRALEAGDVTPVLRWVMPADEAQIKSAFEKALAVRAKGADAKELADQYFFETLVRVHRAGEGMPYTGVKPHGSEVEEGIVAADHAMESGSAEQLKQQLMAAVVQGIDTRFSRAVETAKHANESVAAGRQAVAAYVQFMHYVEGLHMAISAKAHAGHEATPEQPAEHAAEAHPGQESPVAHGGVAHTAHGD